MLKEATQTSAQLLDDGRAGALLCRRLTHGLTVAAASPGVGAAYRAPVATKVSTPVIHPDQERAHHLKLHEQRLAYQQQGYAHHRVTTAHRPARSWARPFAMTCTTRRSFSSTRAKMTKG
jgi:hypothetical protein